MKHKLFLWVLAAFGAYSMDLQATEWHPHVLDTNGSLALNDSVAKAEKKESQGHWGGISFNAVSMAQFQGNLEVDVPTWGSREDLGLVIDDVAESFRIELNPFEYRLRLLGEFVGLTTGLGFDWWHIGISDQRQLFFNDSLDMVQADFSISSNAQMKKNQLDGVYLRVPLLASIRTARSGSKGMHIEAGFVAAYLIHGKYTYEYKLGGQTTNISKDFPISPIQMNARLGVGFKNVSLLSEANLTSFFQENPADQPSLHAFSIGLHFAFND